MGPQNWQTRRGRLHCRAEGRSFREAISKVPSPLYSTSSLLLLRLIVALLGMLSKINNYITFPSLRSIWVVCCRRLFRSSLQSPHLSPTHWSLHTRMRSMCYWTFPSRHLLCWWPDLSRRHCWVFCSRSWMILSSTLWTRTTRPRLMAWAMELNWTRLCLLWLLFWPTLLRLEEKAGKPWRPGSCPTTCKWSRHGYLLLFTYIRSCTTDTNTWLYYTFSW